MEEIAVSVVIPAFNSDWTLEHLWNELKVELGDEVWELILVDDGSQNPKTWETIRKLAEQTPNVRGFRLGRNWGQSVATMFGLEMSRGALVLTMDDDLQHPVSAIPELLEKILTDPDLDCVFGIRASFRETPLRNSATSFFRKQEGTANRSTGDMTGSFRVMKRALVDEVLKYRMRHPRLGIVIPALTTATATVPVIMHANIDSKSNYSYRSLQRLALDSSPVLFDKVPVWIAIVGITGSLMSGLTLILVVVMYLAGFVQVAGYTSQISAIALFGGMNLLGIALIGAMLRRMLSEISGPGDVYVVDSVGNL